MKQQKWRVLLSLLLAMCFCLSAFAPVYAADGLWGSFDAQPSDDTNWADNLKDSWKKLWDRLFGGSGEEEPYAASSDLQYRIVHLDCGRKYFSVDYIKGVIDTMYTNGFNQLELAFGNGGLRFVLDNMDIVSGGSTLHDSEKVKAAIIEGNKAYYDDPNGNYLTETDMKQIIAYANLKNIEIVPLLNMPGHMEGLLSSSLFSAYKLTGKNDKNEDKVAVDSIDLKNSDAVDFAKGILTLYVNWFKNNSVNTRHFNFGADEYANGIQNPYLGTSCAKSTYADMTNFMNDCAKIIENAGMTARCFNDFVCYQNKTDCAVSKTIEVCYWSNQGKWAKNYYTTAAIIKSDGYKMINTNQKWYYVPSKASEYGKETVLKNFVNFDVTKFQNVTADYNLASSDYTEIPVGDQNIGAMFCVWCDTPSVDVALSDVKDLIAAMADANPTYFTKVTEPEKPVIASDGATKGLDGTYGVIVGGSFTLRISDGEDAEWTVIPAGIIELTAADSTVNGLFGVLANETSLTASAVKVTAVAAGTATITATLRDGTALTAAVMATEPGKVSVELEVGEEKQLPVENISDVTDGDVLCNDTIAKVTAAVKNEPGGTERALGSQKALYQRTGTYTGVIYSNGHYMVLNGTTISDTTDINEATVFTVTGTSSTDWWGNTTYSYTIQANGTYITYSSNALTTSTNSNSNKWSCGSGNVFYYNDNSYKVLAYNNKWTVGNDDWSNVGRLFDFSETTTPTVYQTTLTFTGVTPGTTSVTIGGVQYNITVKKIEKTIPLALTVNGSVDLEGKIGTIPSGCTLDYIVKDNTANAISLDGSTVKALAEGAAVVVATATMNGVEVGTYTFNITVSKQQLSAITLPINLWITNAGVLPTGWSNGNPSAFSYTAYTSSSNARSVYTLKADHSGVYSKDGIDLSSILPSAKSGVATSWDSKNYEVVFWKSAYHTSEHRQSTVGWTNESLNGERFTYIRYWNTDDGYEWQYSSDRTNWKDIDNVGADADDTGKNQVNMWFRQVTTLTDEVTTLNVDWGPSGEAESEITHQILDYAVQYESGELTPSSFPNDGKSVVYTGGDGEKYTGKDTTGTYRIVYGITGMETSDYEVYMITLTPSTYTSRKSGPKYNYEEGTEKAIWVKDKESLPDGMTAYEGDTFYGDCVYGGEATVDKVKIYASESLLVTYYVRAKSPNLHVYYHVEGNAAAFYDYGIKGWADSAEGLFNKNFKLENGKLVNNTVKNNLGKTQTVLSDLKSLPAVPAQYKYSNYECVEATVSEDCKEVHLYYRIDSGVTFVVDFGQPFTITPGNINEALVNATISEASAEYPSGLLTIDYSDANKIKVTPKKVIDGEINFKLTYSGNIALEDGVRQDKVVYNVKILPASNVLYEESFFNETGEATNNWTQAGTPAADRTQATEKLREKSKNYGYDSSYANDNEFSGGSALKAEVSVGLAADQRPCAEFTFTGTGFDIISECSNQTGMLFVRVGDAGGNYVKSYIVDTYFNGDKGSIMTSGTMTYQIPVVRCTGLTYGTYQIRVKGLVLDTAGAVAAQNASVNAAGLFSVNAFDSHTSLGEVLGLTAEELSNLEILYMDENSVLNGGSGAEPVYSNGDVSLLSSFELNAASTNGKYDVYLDGFRIYNPLGTDNGSTSSQYETDGENGFVYTPVYDALLADENRFFYVEGDGSKAVTEENITNYKKNGPENEVYLAPAASIAFKVEKNGVSVDSMQISAKTVSGAPAKLNGQEITSAAEMYYTVTKNAETDYFVITNDGATVLSISEMKVPSGAELPDLTEADQQAALDAINAVLSAPVDPVDPVDPEPEPEPETFEPQLLKAYASAVAFRRWGATITVTSSIEEGMEVYIRDENGESMKLTPNNTRMVRWGLADTYRYSFSTGRLSAGTHTYYVYAVRDGLESAPVAVTFTVW